MIIRHSCICANKSVDNSRQQNNENGNFDGKKLAIPKSTQHLFKWDNSSIIILSTQLKLMRMCTTQFNVIIHVRVHIHMCVIIC